VFGAVEPVAEQEIVAEPELSKASARKVIDSLRDLLSTVADREDYADLRSPLEEILAAAQSVGGSVKDDSETKPKRKRRSKNEDDEASTTDTATATSIEVAESSVVAVEAEPVAAQSAAVAEEVMQVELVAEVNTVADPVVETAEIEEEVPTDVVVDEVNNDEVRDEILELIDSNVPAGNLNNLIATTAYAVYLGSQDSPLSLGSFLDAMTLETVKGANGADYLDDEMRGLVANMLEDSAYVDSALTWFVSGVRALENGKDFPVFEGGSQAVAADETPSADDVVDEVFEEVPVNVPETVVQEEQPVEEDDLTSADDHTIVGQVDTIEDAAAEAEPMVLEEAEDVLDVAEEAIDAVEVAPVVVEPVSAAPAPLEKPATAPARPAPSAPADGLKKPNFFQRPSFPTKG
jgi:hypothetical protein